MPTYEYSCDECGERFSYTESISAHERHKAACPACGSKKVSRVMGPFFAKTAKKS